MLPVTLEAAAAAMRARIVVPSGWDGGLRRPFPPASIDSRTIRPGDCFFALVGDRRDGHDFVGDACRAGAEVVVLSRPVGGLQVPALVVPDTTRALQDLGRYCRKEWGGRVFSVTGSMGKTTTRRFLAALLRTRYRVLETLGNFNNHLGVPLSLLCLEPQHEIAVLELGMNHSGEITQLAGICLPDAGLVTNVAAVHTQFFASLEEVARAKEELVRSLPETGWLVFNADDPRVAAMAQRYRGRSVSFGFGTGADYRIVEIEAVGLSATRFAIEGPGGKLNAEIRFLGRGFVANAAAAVAAAVELGVDVRDIPAVLRQVRPGGHRGEFHEWGQVSVYDDSYNSNPEAVATLLEAVAAVRGNRRWILALGDMLELGEQSADHHRRIGRLAAQAAPDMLVTVGDESRHLAMAALEAGFPCEQQHHFENAESAASLVRDWVRPGDLVVVKGSRGIGMERIVAVLKGEAA
jgi:UDP-N-acetylmuramoyl-tripeptide--D-alanyl-D-alanine ligase